MLKFTAAFAVAASALLLAGTAAAFTPDRSECIAPAKPGGGFDLTCRIAMNGFEETKLLAKPMEVSFMPGGIGAVAYAHMNSNRRNDPSAIVAFSGGSLLNIAQGKFGQNLDENNARWLASAGADFGAIIVKADAPWKDLKELAAAVKADPTKYVVGAGGTVGSQDWMKAALFMKAAGGDAKKMRYVAFEGGGESIAALLGGHIQIYTGDAAEMKGRINDGTMRMLAVLADKRLPGDYANVPTAKEQGFDIEWTIIRGFYLGPDVNDEAYDWWVGQFKKMFAMPVYAKVQEEKGLFPFEMAGKEFDVYVKKLVAEYRQIAKDAGLTK
ncbi:MAG: tripartite tricarboxylate transporter substrate binding protein [Rhodospirillales bacterium]|nr:tripartite tricarboxylate transporter substrate binding protein [Rhodospirillales bacterium]